MTKPHWPPGPYWERATAAGVAAAVEAGAAEEAASGVVEVEAAVACAYDIVNSGRFNQLKSVSFAGHLILQQTHP